MNMRQSNREVLTDPFNLIRDLTLHIVQWKNGVFILSGICTFT